MFYKNEIEELKTLMLNGFAARDLQDKRNAEEFVKLEQEVAQARVKGEALSGTPGHKKVDHGINGVARQKDVQKLEKRVEELERMFNLIKYYDHRSGRYTVDIHWKYTQPQFAEEKEAARLRSGED